MSASPLLLLLRTRARLLPQVLLFVLAVVLACGLLPAGSAAAAPVTVEQCEGISNVGGQGIDCSITVVNTFDAATGVGSSTVTVQACTGAANAATTCTGPTTTAYPDVTTTIEQCNGSANGGGGTATCTVSITNDITGGAAPAAATVKQCIGSGGAGTAFACSPTQNTTGATVDQCNGSVDGGGGALTCTVASASTQSASLPISVNQCNGSARGGGAFLTCRTTITTNRIAAAAPPASASPTAAASASPTAAPAPSPSAPPSAAVTPSTSPSTAPTGAPVASTAPAAPPVEPAPLQPAPDAVPDSGVLPDTLSVPVVAQETDATQPLATSTALPTTGADADVLALLGIATTAAGGVLLRVARRPRGRHVLR